MVKDTCFLYGAHEIVRDHHNIYDIKEKYVNLKAKIVDLDSKRFLHGLSPDEEKELDSLVREIRKVWDEYNEEMQKLEDTRDFFVNEINKAIDFYDYFKEDRDTVVLWLRGFTENNIGT